MPKNKTFSFALVIFLAVTLFAAPTSFAQGFKEAGASLLLPTTGQAMNGQLGNTKTKVMAGIEVAAVTAVTILGIASGGGVVLFAAAPLAANHLWSATDAYRGAKAKQTDPNAEQQILDAQRNIELSRQRRFERERTERSDIRERIQRAGERAS